MIAGPALQRSASANFAVDTLIYAGFLWMGFAWLFLVTTLLGDLSGGLHRLFCWATGSDGLGPKAIAYVRFGFYGTALIAGVWAVAQALRTPPLREIHVEIPNLPAEFENYRIVHLSDTHLGPILRQDWLGRIIAEIQDAHPDLVVHTGDLVDGSVGQLGEMISPIQNIQSKDGKIFVTGNHESYSGPKAWTDYMQKMGWTVLLNQHITLRKGNAQITIGGVTDVHEGQFLPERASNPHAAFAGSAPSDVRILLAHQPVSALDAQDLNIGLQLSGHTHGGQIWPFKYLVPLQQPMNTGLAMVGKVQVFTTTGTGFWGPPMRLFAPSEIPVLILHRKN